MRLKFTFATFFCFILFVFPEGAFPQTAPSVDAVVNSASFAAGPFAPGEQIDIFGRNFGAGVDFSKSFPLRTNILGVSVSLGGRPLPLFYVDFGQITAQVPYGLAANTTQQLIVQAGNTSSAPFAVTVAAAAPVIFTVNQIGTGQGEIQYADGTLNSASKPAATGSIVIVYLTGGGETSPAGVEGVPPSGVSHYIQAASATIDGQPASIAFAGPTPGAVGEEQVNLTVPANVGPGSVPIVITIGGVASQQGVTIAVSGSGASTTATTMSLSASPNPSSTGQVVTLTATVATAGPGGATGTVTFSDGTSTLGLTALSGGEATLSTSGLTAGTHSIQARYSGDATHGGSSATVAVTVSGTSTPTVAPTALAFTYTKGSFQPAGQTLTVGGGGAHAFSITHGEDFWLSVSPNSGNTPATLTVIVNGASFGPGVFSGHITVLFDTGDVAVVQVTLTVSAASCAPSSLVTRITSLEGGFKVTAGQPVSLQVSVADNCGVPASGLSAPVTASFSNGDPPPKLSGTGSGTFSGAWVPVGTGTVTIQFNASELLGTGTVITAPVASITGTVVSPVVSTLQAAPAALSFNVQSGASPATAALAVTSTGDPLAFAVLTSGGGWLAASPTSGTTPLTVTVTIDPSKLTTPGTYTGSVQFAVGATVVPVPVNVTFTVPAPKLLVPVTPLSFTAESGPTVANPQVVTVTASGGSVPFTTTPSTTSGGPWLSVDPVSGATDANLTIAVKQGNLSPGPYSGMVTVTAPDANGGTFQIPVGLTVTAPAAVTSLLATPAGLQFQFQINSTAPGPQTLNIGSSGDAVNFLATAAGAGTPPWFKVSPRTGRTNTPLQVSVLPGGLAAGTYSGSIEVAPTDSNATPVSVPVQLTVTPQITYTLTTDTTQITPSAALNSPPQQFQVTVAGTGPNLLNFSVQTATASGSWLRVSLASGGASADQPATIVVTTDPAGLATGTYSGTVTIDGPSSQIVIPVAFAIGTKAAALVLTQTALTFRVAPPNFGLLSQDVKILATGQGTVNFTANAQSDGNWLTVTPASGQAIAGSRQNPSMSVGVNVASLASGEYSGHIQVQSPDVDDSPLSINVVLQVVRASDLGPVTVPTGLAFVATAGGAAPAPQPVQLLNPSGQTQYNASVLLDPSSPADIPQWLQFKDASNGGDLFKTIAVSVSPAGLSPNTNGYRGTISVNFPGNIIRAVAVLLVVTPASTGASAATFASPRAAAPVCVPSQYLPLFASLEQNFSVAQGAPASTEIVVVDDCGNAVTSGTTGSTFSTGDRPLNLLSLGDGRWRATWVPRGGQGYTSVNVVATDTAQTIASSQGPPQLSGFVQNSIHAPVLSVAGAITTLDGQPQLALAPGSWIQISGTRLADSAVQVSGVPQPQVGNTTVSVGGVPLLLQSVAPGGIVALVPGNISVNTSLPLVVANGSYLSAPEQVLVAQSWPVVQSASLEGEGPARSLVLEVTGVGAMDGERARAPFAVEIGGKRVRVERLSVDPARVGVYRVRLPMGSEDWAGATVEVVGATARTSRKRVTGR